ncbi:polysaccharide lyase family 7 protein [Plantibacter sp. Mn2098]|uniref:polysaccharide lyase family 7 protein n=1 Tax=Plantibacter sp. Mn2098 TaxID=3395266 RepID=UPI003BCFA21A
MKRRTVLVAVVTAGLIAAGVLLAVPNLVRSGTDGHAQMGSGPDSQPSAVPPGSRFDLSDWELQLPTGAQGAPTTIPPTALTGPRGYANAKYFSVDSSGAMTFWAPENGVTTAHSDYARSELREMNPSGTLAEWPVTENHTLTATVAVPDVTKRVCVGQVHLGTGGSSTKALAEIYYDASGQITLGLGTSPDGPQAMHQLGRVPLGQRWTYAITIDDHHIRVTINGSASDFRIPASFDAYDVYFKAGSYNQSSSASSTNGARVEIYQLALTR